MKRVFFGIDLPEDIKNNIYILAKKLNIPGGRLINPENLHLTLRFIGRATEEQITFLRRGMDRVCKEIKPFSVKFGEVGAFASNKKARVVWISLGDEEEQIRTLAQKAEDIAYESGFGKENRFHPHVTFVRFKNPRNVIDFIEIANNLFGEFAGRKIFVDRIVMFESILKPTGAQYSTLYEFLLG